MQTSNSVLLSVLNGKLSAELQKHPNTNKDIDLKKQTVSRWRRKLPEDIIEYVAQNTLKNQYSRAGRGHKVP